VAINSPQWNVVRSALGADTRTLFERVEREITDETGETKSLVSFEPATPAGQSALEAFKQIEADVERLIQEVTSLQIAERELRSALEEPGGAETQRR
jgi:hypothetical protein